METTVTIRRYNPTYDLEPYDQTYHYELIKGMTVLDVLNLLRSQQDPTLSYYFNCRNVHCGLCGLTVNGKPVLSCHYIAKPDMKLEPLAGFSVLQDLSVDRDGYEKRRTALRLFPERTSVPAIEPEPIDMERFGWFQIASRCIECYSCVSICPIYKKIPHLFAGPAALNLQARCYFDPRDELNRFLILSDMGLEHCVGCKQCSKVCPVDADPCGMILRIKKELLKGEE